MQTLFNRTPVPERGIIVSGSWSVARAGLNRNLAQVVSYFQNRSMSIRSDHLLVKLINTPKLNYDQPLERFYEQIDVMTPSLSMFYKLTSSTFAGDVHNGVFYGGGTSEVIIGSSEGIDLYEAFNHWQHQSPVRIIDHEKTDLEMHVPNGVAYSQETGMAVICINLPLLFVMYRGFVLAQMEELRKGKQAKTTAQFVHTYVLPNAIASHLDIALFNRAVLMSLGKSPSLGTSRKHPFAMANWTPQVDKVLKELTNHLMRSNHSSHDMLCTLPAVTASNSAEALHLPVLSPTYQYAWCELVARSRALAGLIYMSPSNLSTYDKGHLQRISRTIAYDGFKQVIQRKLPLPHADSTLSLLEQIETVAAKN